MVLVKIWKNKNGLIFESMEFDALSVVRKAFNDMNEWAQAQVVEAINSSVPSVGPTESQVEWSPPPVLWRKCDIELNGIKVNKFVELLGC